LADRRAPDHRVRRPGRQPLDRRPHRLVDPQVRPHHPPLPHHRNPGRRPHHHRRRPPTPTTSATPSTGSTTTDVRTNLAQLGLDRGRDQRLRHLPSRDSNRTTAKLPTPWLTGLRPSPARRVAVVGSGWVSGHSFVGLRSAGSRPWLGVPVTVFEPP
jgi:hypothetical protein